MNKTQLKNLNKMSDRKNLTKNAEQKDSGEQRWTKELGCEQRGTRTIIIIYRLYRWSWLGYNRDIAIRQFQLIRLYKWL